MNADSGVSSGGRVGSPSRPESIDSSHVELALEGGSESRPYLSENKPSRLWLWFVAAFVAQALAWAAWLTIAAHYKVEEIPVPTQRAR